MRKVEKRLLKLTKNYDINYKDAALILLTKDRLKPFAAIAAATKNMHSEQKKHLMKLLRDLSIPFGIEDGRILIGSKLVKEKRTLDTGLNFGFPLCCVLEFEKKLKRSFKDKNKIPSFFSPYIFHVPCCSRCKETEILEAEYKRHIRKNYPQIAGLVEKFHKRRFIEA